MSRSGQITLEWGDGEHVFALKIKHLIELQEKCDAGPPYILARLTQSQWHVEDVRETIRLGLIGGGLEAHKALRLVADYVDDAPIAYHALTAQAVLSAALFGAPEGQEDAPPGKPQADQGSAPYHGESFDGPPTSEPGSPPE